VIQLVLFMLQKEIVFFLMQSSGPPNNDNFHLPPPAARPASRSSPGLFRGGPPPPVVLDESRLPSHTPLAPMKVDHPPHPHDYPGSSHEGPSCGLTGHQTLLLHHLFPSSKCRWRSFVIPPFTLPVNTMTTSMDVHSGSFSVGFATATATTYFMCPIPWPWISKLPSIQDWLLHPQGYRIATSSVHTNF
jgi:hypothetical protein